MRTKVSLIIFQILLIVISLVSCAKKNEMRDRVSESLSSESPFLPGISYSGGGFSFSVLGDIHQGNFMGNDLVKALDDIQSKGDLFSLVLGDLTESGREEDFVSVQEGFSSRQLTVRTVLGNHDTYQNGWSNYKKYFGPSIYRFDVGSRVSFFILDTANGYIGSDQFQWLESELKSNMSPVKIIALHTPVYMGPTRSLWQLASDEEGAQLKYLAHKYGVKLFLSGHYHGYTNNYIDGVDFVVSGGINHLQDGADPSHYLRITITESDDLLVEKIDL